MSKKELTLTEVIMYLTPRDWQEEISAIVESGFYHGSPKLTIWFLSVRSGVSEEKIKAVMSSEDTFTLNEQFYLALDLAYISEYKKEDGTYSRYVYAPSIIRPNGEEIK